MSRYTIRARGTDAPSELRIYGDIGTSWWAEESNDARTIVSKLDEIPGAVDIRINSFGGSVADGLAIFNAIRRRQSPTKCYVDGVAYSIASLIAMAADEVHLAENAMLMIHAPWGASVGNAQDMRDFADVLDKNANAMVSSYLRAGGPDESTIRGWLTDGKDHYFTAQEASDLGLCDVVGPPVETQIAAALRDVTRYQIPAALCRSPREVLVTTENPGTDLGATQKAADIVQAHSKTVARAEAEGIKKEAKRRADLSAVFASFYDADPLNPITALHDACMEDTQCDELAARRRLLDHLAASSASPILAREAYAPAPAPSAPPGASRHLGGAGAVLISRDVQEKRAAGLQAALSIKAGLITDHKTIDQERRGEFLSQSLVDIMAHELRAAGYPVAGSREDIGRRYLQAMPIMAAGPSHGTDHLPAVLGNIANLSAQQGWDGTPETWNVWTQSGTLNNYQTHTRANIALLDKLTKMLENQEWEYGDMADVKQRITGYFYGLKYSLSIQAIVNDDLGELTRTMQGWGEAANATVGDVVHALLFTSGTGGYGQTMDEDSKVCFHADHSNYVASGSGAVPSETTINTAWAAMVARTDPNSRKVAAVPRYLIHGPGLRGTVYKALRSEQLQSVTVDGSTGATVLSGSSNSLMDLNLVPVMEHRIVASAPGANAWVLAAARRTVEVAGVGGPVRPRADQSLVSNTPGITYELSMPFGAAILDHRGLYMNFGA